MNQFTLTDDLLTGVADIDDQHRKLFMLANQLIEAGTTPRSRLAVLQALAFLGGYIDYHFAAEELAMRDNNYSSYVEHNTFHESFREQVCNLAEAAQTGESTELLILRVAALLTDWLITHIRFMDRDFADYLKRITTKNSIHLPSSSRLKEEGLVPSDYVVPDHPGAAPASKSPSSS